MGQAGPELYHGNLLLIKNNPRRKSSKVDVSLKEYISYNGSRQKYYKLKIKRRPAYVFSSDELYFYEKEEEEFEKTSHNDLSLCLGRDSAHKKHRKNIYTVISIVIIKNDGHIPLSFCEARHHENEERSIDNLWQTLVSEFGEIKSWFLESKDDENRKLRLAISGLNFCLLDASYKNSYNYKFKSVKCDVTYHAETETLDLEVREDVGITHTEFSTSTVIKLKTTRRFAEDIRKLMIQRTLNRADEILGGNQAGEWVNSVSHVSHSSCTEESRGGTQDFDLSIWQPTSNEELPLPTPCTPEKESIHASFPPPKPHTPKRNISKILYRNDFESPPKLPPKPHLFRSQSTSFVSDYYSSYKKGRMHVYENIFSHDDSVYTYRLYINEPTILRKSRMRVKIDRWIRLSDELDVVDPGVAMKHELWHEEEFKNRHNDDKYRKVCSAPNIIGAEVYSSPRDTEFNILSSEDETDDLYWKGDLCLTIQKVMEGNIPNLWNELDLTRPQYLQLAMLLESRAGCVRSKGWIELASWIGIKSTSDIETIMHFCYTRKMLIMDVVFSHWWFLCQKNRNVPEFSYQILNYVLVNMDRRDLLNILQRTDTNIDEDEVSDDDNTKL